MIEGLFLDPEHIGQGLGKQLVAHAQHLSTGGLKVDVNEQNAAAVSFYARLGFRVVERSPTGSAGRPFRCCTCSANGSSPWTFQEGGKVRPPRVAGSSVSARSSGLAVRRTPSRLCPGIADGIDDPAIAFLSPDDKQRAVGVVLRRHKLSLTHAPPSPPVWVGDGLG